MPTRLKLSWHRCKGSVQGDLWGFGATDLFCTIESWRHLDCRLNEQLEQLGYPALPRLSITAADLATEDATAAWQQQLSVWLESQVTQVQYWQSCQKRLLLVHEAHESQNAAQRACAGSDTCEATPKSHASGTHRI